MTKLILPFAALLAAALPVGASAQQPAPPATTEPAWRLICPTATESAAEPCSLMQNLVAGEQQQRLLTLVIRRAVQGGHAMTIALPHGVHFPAGVSVQVDEGAQQMIAVETSDPNAAYAGTAIDAAMLAAMRGGTSLKIGFTTSSGQRLVVPVTLRDFAAGIDQLERSPAPAQR